MGYPIPSGNSVKPQDLFIPLVRHFAKLKFNRFELPNDKFRLAGDKDQGMNRLLAWPQVA
ncbi:MAG TPA: hypothetical protein DCM28_09855 [Phycisphaerales bacterium]|nr:hypothetical protein [Phycisphaerales bacterium]HCD33903.1 hypothetical protein [Phycisphaerales bacterium]|tara:strand:- start:918 stop:1097 length:180 start_codon:yes stop_codon:yes gene_type:complete